MKNNKLIKNKQVFLYISIFYAEQAWHLLIKNGLLPFLMGINKQYDKYLIWFGKNRGEHIAITFLIKADKVASFLQHFDAYFKSFLSQKPSKLNGKGNNLTKNIFIDFPNNSVQYNIHKIIPRLFNKLDYNYINLWCDSSTILLNSFNKFLSSYEDLSTGYLYIIITLFLLYDLNAKDKGLMNNIIVHEAFNDIYYKNESMLKKILDDCHSVISNRPERRLVWLREWIDIIKIFVDRYVAYNPNISILDIVTNIKYTMQQQLGINRERSILFQYFIDKMIYSANKA